MDAVYWDILVTIRNQLRTEVAFEGFDGVDPIPPEQIIIKFPPPYNRRKDGAYSEALSPGIVITPGRQVQVEAVGGTWEFDDVRYPVLIQLVDTEMDEYHEARMRSWLKWLEQVRKYLCHGNLKTAVMEDKGFVSIVYAPSTNVLDESQFYILQNCVGLISIVCESREPRDPLGTN